MTDETRKVLFRWNYDEHGRRVLREVENSLRSAGVSFVTEYDEDEPDDRATIYAKPETPR